MSEYQFYDFKSIDKPLTSSEKETISGWSSRTRATSRGATFTYSYSNFPKDELKVVEEYFDAMFHISNWGTRRLILKIPNDFVDAKEINQYCAEGLAIYEFDSFVLIDIWLEDEDGDCGWMEGDGILSSLITLRDDIISGDYRCLYLVWLEVSTKDVKNDYGYVDADSLEPEVPLGLNQLSGELHEFAEVFGIDEDTIKASAIISEPKVSADVDYSSYITKLTDKEKDNWILRLLEGEPLLSEKINRQMGRQEQRSIQIKRRTVNEIVGASLSLKNKREWAKKKIQDEKRLIKLEKLESEKDMLWEKVYSLISEKKPKAYDEAVQLLVSLKELAVFNNDFTAFKDKIEEIKKHYNRLSGLKARIDSAKLFMN